ncbi:HEPN domain-containing protein [Candidatus Sumerlaeota bacterium]|nr:HEPN domain-containing protein [Candidatus Sumerlaeota bacterium]
MKNPDKVKEWFIRARSNFARAKIGAGAPHILYEDLCFDSQQAVEKALKALCISEDIIFPKTHDIAFLFDLLEEKVEIPEDIRKARILNEYAVELRYPGSYSPVDEEEYRDSVKLAESALLWVEEKLKGVL